MGRGGGGKNGDYNLKYALIEIEIISPVLTINISIIYRLLCMQCDFKLIIEILLQNNVNKIHFNILTPLP